MITKAQQEMVDDVVTTIMATGMVMCKTKQAFVEFFNMATSSVSHMPDVKLPDPEEMWLNFYPEDEEPDDVLEGIAEMMGGAIVTWKDLEE
jgi:hypothetical protein